MSGTDGMIAGVGAEDSGGGAQPARRRAGRAVLRLGVLVLLTICGAFLAVWLFGAQHYRWRAVGVDLSVHPALEGCTTLAFPPIGSVNAATHRTPVRLQLDLTNISLDATQSLIAKRVSRAALEQELTDTARRDLRRFAMHLLLVGAAGGLLGPLLLHARRARVWAASLVLGSGAVFGVMAATVRTYQPKAFNEPTYQGTLREARWLIGAAKGAFAQMDALSDQLQSVARNVNRLYQRIGAAPDLDERSDAITVLHVSDIHNNQAAVAFARELAAGSRIDLVVNTGDLTDLGIPVETQLSRGLRLLKAPHVFVPGNHDSPAIVEAIGRYPGVSVLRGEPVQLAGLSVLGAPDPGAEGGGPDNVDPTPEALREASEVLAAQFDTMERPPDLVCVHNAKQAEALIGKARLVLCGHSHRASVQVDRGTVICNAGTTGAAGVRYLSQEGGVPFSAAVLTFSRDETPKLLSIDLIELSGSLGQYSITRRAFNGRESGPAGVPADVEGR